jgi:hypothetical protein
MLPFEGAKRVRFTSSLCFFYARAMMERMSLATAIQGGAGGEARRGRRQRVCQGRSVRSLRRQKLELSGDVVLSREPTLKQPRRYPFAFPPCKCVKREQRALHMTLARATRTKARGCAARAGGGAEVKRRASSNRRRRCLIDRQTDRCLPPASARRRPSRAPTRGPPRPRRSPLALERKNEESEATHAPWRTCVFVEIEFEKKREVAKRKGDEGTKKNNPPPLHFLGTLALPSLFSFSLLIFSNFCTLRTRKRTVFTHSSTLLRLLRLSSRSPDHSQLPASPTAATPKTPAALLADRGRLSFPSPSPPASSLGPNLTATSVSVAMIASISQAQGPSLLLAGIEGERPDDAPLFGSFFRRSSSAARCSPATTKR